jgi:hypothetical protein
MIQEYADDLAAQMGIKISRVSVVDGRLLGCRESNLLQLYSDGHMESALIYQQELVDLQSGVSHPRLESRIRAALSRLKIKLEP